MRTIIKNLRTFSVSIAAGLLSLLAVTAVSAATLTYPGAAPCNTTLQACIDAAASGDIVEIATNTPIAESPSIDSKSLTLRAAAGFTPALTAYNYVLAVTSGSAAHTFTIQGITLTVGFIGIGQGGTGPMTANVWNNTVLETFSYGEAVRIWAGNVSPPPTRGDIFYSVLDNQLTVAVGSQNHGVSIQANDMANSTGVIQRNRIVMQGADQGSAVDLANGTRLMTVDVIGNIISGTNYDSGISLFQYAPGGTINARVINNLVTGQNGNVGAPAAISVNDSQGTLNFSLINNTLSSNRTGILISGRSDLGAAMYGTVANNIVANSSQTGIAIDTDFEPTVTNRYNLFFNNPNNWFTPGANTLYVDPQFVGGGDFHLQSTSPAVDVGDNSAIPAGITTDLGGSPRIQGGTVDMGAYERTSGSGGGSTGGTVVAPGTYSISGVVTSAISSGSGSGTSYVAGVTMALAGTATATTTTDTSGYYVFSGLSNGPYTITPSLAGKTFTPVSRGVIVSGASLSGQNFTASP
ncbi:MAG: hypothetical protein HY942_04020 [Gammaproteobacteria bacterium]|nr:hypothetical protein [Gammaproteobacteria bacterium]